MENEDDVMKKLEDTGAYFNITETGAYTKYFDITNLASKLIGEDLITYKDQMVEDYLEREKKAGDDEINVLTQGYCFTSSENQAIGFKINTNKGVENLDKMLMLKLPRFTFTNDILDPLKSISRGDLKAFCKNVVILDIDEVQKNYTYYYPNSIGEESSLTCLQFVSSEYILKIFVDGKRIN